MYIKYKHLALIFVFLGLNFYGQELEKNQIFLADPTIFEENGRFYLYGTKGDPRIAGEGFLVYTSTDLKNWKGPVGANNGYALRKGDSFGTQGFWAPQVFKHNGKYHMAYTANEKIAIATSDHPLGPFVNEMNALDSPVKQIDPFIFFANGKPYLYHVRLQEGNKIFVAEMTKDLREIKSETLKKIIEAETGWEDTQDVEWTVTEGPTVFKKNDLFYLLYSANDFRNQDYAVGYATSKNPMGPWIKAEENPIISKENLGFYGSGHGDVFNNGKGRVYYVLHTHYSFEKVHPRKTAITELDIDSDPIKIKENSFRWLKL